VTVKTNNPFSREFTLDDIGHVISRNSSALADFLMARVVQFTPSLSAPANAAMRDQIRLTLSRLSIYNPIKLNYTTWPFADATTEGQLLVVIQDVLKIRLKLIQSGSYVQLKDEIRNASDKLAKTIWSGIRATEDVTRAADIALKVEVSKAYAAVPES
jgi:hypothetical protein